VPAADSERAFKTLRQYRAENRSGPWQQPLKWPHAFFDWAAVVWAVALIIIYWWSERDVKVLNAGIMDTSRVMAGQWWRICTAITLHENLAHLAENLSIGVVLFGLAMGRFGTGVGLLAAFLAGVAGNVTSLTFNAKPFDGLGASGMVMGALGLLAAQSLRWAGGKRDLKVMLGSVIAGVMLFVLFGLSPGTDFAAHCGGFVGGLVLGAAMVYVPDKFLHGSKVNLVAIIVLTALITLAWRLAIRHG
jgi:membrane associated rhomboid family serine protease